MIACAITMVYRDYWALGQWYQHYAKYLGPENLYIVVDGPDPDVIQHCPDANLIHVPRGDQSRFDLARNWLLNGFQSGLAQKFDWIIRTDVDELICLDPDYYSSFNDFFEKSETQNAIFALGLELVERRSDTGFLANEPVFSHRSSAEFSSHYSKAWAFRGPFYPKSHGVSAKKVDVENQDYYLPEGVYLLHLKYANLRETKVLDLQRELIASGTGKNLPGNRWKNASKRRQVFLTDHDLKPLAQWQDVVAAARNQMQRNQKRNALRGVLKTDLVTFDYRVKLPDWFKSL